MSHEQSNNNRSHSHPAGGASRARAATEPVIPALNGEIQPAPLLPVDSLTLFDAAAAQAVPFFPPQNPRPPRESLQSQIRAQLRQVLGLGQPHNHANNLQEMAVTLRPVAPPPPLQPLVQALNLSTVQPPVGQMIDPPRDHHPQHGPGFPTSQSTSLLALDSQLRTPFLQALNLSQQEITQNQARLQAFRAAVEASLQQTTSLISPQPAGVMDVSQISNFSQPHLNLTVDRELMGSQMATTREDFIFLADCSFRAHRHEELLAHVRSFLLVLGPKRDLVKDERYFIAVGYKDSIRGVRDAWRKIKKMEVDEKDAFKLRVSSKYRSDLETQMRSVCTEGLQVATGLLNDIIVSMETRLYFSKVKGDLYRYMAEYSTGAEKAEAASLGRSAYEEADRTKSCVTAVHPLRLGLALNFGVFLRDACQDSNRGWRVTKVALDDANRGFQMLAELDSNDYRESNGLLMNLRRNLMRWNTADIEVDGQNTATTNQLAVRN